MYKKLLLLALVLAGVNTLSMDAFLDKVKILTDSRFEISSALNQSGLSSNEREGLQKRLTESGREIAELEEQIKDLATMPQ